MSRLYLSKTDDWQLANPEQDVRGTDLMGPDGTRIGTVRDMVLDTDAERVTALMLDDGTEISADDVTLQDGVITQGGAASSVSVFSEAGRLLRREPVGGSTRSETDPPIR